jgi:hypothetical protein
MPDFSPDFALNTTVDCVNNQTKNPVKSLPHNCHTVSLYNPSATETVLFKVGNVDALNPIAAADGGAVPPQSSFTMAIGTLTKRPKPRNKLVYSLQATGAGTVTLFITYVCGNRL